MRAQAGSRVAQAEQKPLSASNHRGSADAPEPPPNATLMRELARLEGPPGPPGEEAWVV
jgi:hypothetical protein